MVVRANVSSWYHDNHSSQHLVWDEQFDKRRILPGHHVSIKPFGLEWSDCFTDCCCFGISGVIRMENFGLEAIRPNTHVTCRFEAWCWHQFTYTICFSSLFTVEVVLFDVYPSPLDCVVNSKNPNNLYERRLQMVESFETFRPYQRKDGQSFLVPSIRIHCQLASLNFHASFEYERRRYIRDESSTDEIKGDSKQL